MGRMSSDDLKPLLDRAYVGPEVHAQAYEVLARRHAQGKLPPVLDGTGDPLNDYVEILGIEI